jgi:pilus assembly protein TadC
MEWSQVLAIIVGNATIFVPLFFWLRTEANADRRQIQQGYEIDKRDLLRLIREIKDELKDFHVWLRTMEERNKK